MWQSFTVIEVRVSISVRVKIGVGLGLVVVVGLEIRSGDELMNYSSIRALFVVTFEHL